MKSFIYAVFHLHLLWPSNIYTNAYTFSEISQVLPLLWYKIIHVDHVVAEIYSIHETHLMLSFATC